MQETAKRLVALCRERSVSLCTAESCTGGMIAQRLTGVPGASEVFLGALVTYAVEKPAAKLILSRRGKSAS